MPQEQDLEVLDVEEIGDILHAFSLLLYAKSASTKRCVALTLFDEYAALLRMRHEVVDSRGHVPSQVDPRPVIDGLNRHNAVMEMAVTCRAVV